LEISPVGGWLMMIELHAAFLILKKWNQNPAATTRQLGIWQHWKRKTESNDRPLTEVEAERMKDFLRRNAPTSYFTIFAEEKTDW
jgi:hypothetical protein